MFTEPKALNIFAGVSFYIKPWALSWSPTAEYSPVHVVGGSEETSHLLSERNAI